MNPPKPERAELGPLNVRLPRELVRRLNVMAAEEDKYLYEIVEELLRLGLRDGRQDDAK